MALFSFLTLNVGDHILDLHTFGETRWVHEFLKVICKRLLFHHPLSLSPEPEPQGPVILSTEPFTCHSEGKYR